jgi:hypothetical protein
MQQQKPEEMKYLAVKTCQHAIGDTQMGRPVFCGRHVAPGVGYCGGHVTPSNETSCNDRHVFQKSPAQAAQMQLC